MSENKYTLGEAAVGFTLAPFVLAAITVLVLPFSLWQAWVLVQLWSWFVVPYFHAPTISVWLVMGLLLIYGSVTKTSEVKKEAPETNWTSTFIVFVFGPAFSLTIGYLIHHFAGV